MSFYYEMANGTHTIKDQFGKLIQSRKLDTVFSYLVNRIQLVFSLETSTASDLAIDCIVDGSIRIED